MLGNRLLPRSKSQIFFTESSLCKYVVLIYIFHNTILKMNIVYEFLEFELGSIIKLFRNMSTNWAILINDEL